MFFGFNALQSFVIIIALFVVVYWIMPKKLNWISFLFVTVLLAVLAFKIEPNETDDLYRYFDTLDYLRSGGREALENCFKNEWNHWHIYRACGWYFYFISKFPDNHYLSAVTIFIVYGLMFMLIHKTSVRYETSKFDTFLGAMFFLSTYWYYDTASGIRNGLAFAVVFTCAYHHLLLRKHIPLCVIGYILACLTHSAAIMPVVFVALAVITLNNTGKFINFLLVFGIIGGGAGIQFLASVFPGNSFLQSIAGKVEANELQETLYTQTNYLTNIATLIFVIIVVFYFSYYILNSDHSKDVRLFYKYCSIILFFVVGSLYSPLIFMRFSRWIIPIIGSLFFIAGRQSQVVHISNNDELKIKYYSQFNERIRYSTKSLVFVLYVAYTAVHMWYLVFGSSLNWIHF